MTSPAVDGVLEVVSNESSEIVSSISIPVTRGSSASTKAWAVVRDAANADSTLVNRS